MLNFLRVLKSKKGLLHLHGCLDIVQNKLGLLRDRGWEFRTGMVMEMADIIKDQYQGSTLPKD